MPKIVQITFYTPHGDSDVAKEAARERAEKIAEWPGLLWKVWIADSENNLYGGVYLFQDEARARAYLEGPIVESIQSIPGISEFQAKLFDVEENLTAITRGPLTP